MKNLLLTTAAALACIMTGSSASADHLSQDGQEKVAYGYGFGYTNPYANQFHAGYGPVNQGWGGNSYPAQPYTTNYVGSQFYGSGNLGCGYGQNWNGGYSNWNPNFNGYSNWNPNYGNGILAGGCYSNGGQVICPANRYQRIYQPYGFGY